MKMHPKPMVRHTQFAEVVDVTPRFESGNYNAPYHVNFAFKRELNEAHATQTLVMTRDEAVTLFETLGVMLRFEDAKASEIDTDHWADCHKDMRRAITPVCSHDWEHGFSMNGPTRICKRCGQFERD